VFIFDKINKIILTFLHKDLVNFVSSLSDLSTLLCLRNTAIIHLWNEFSNYPRLAIHCKNSIDKNLTIIDFLRDIALLSRQKWIIVILALPWNSFSPNWIIKKKIGTEIESVCFNFVVLWRRNEDSHDLSPTRDFQEKKIKRKQDFSESPEYFKIEKTCFAHFLVFEREKLALPLYKEFLYRGISQQGIFFTRNFSHKQGILQQGIIFTRKFFYKEFSSKESYNKEFFL
jgi:hypothetical protein